MPITSIREPVKKKKMWKIPHLGGGPDPGIFHISKKKKKVVFKMHFKPF